MKLLRTTALLGIALLTVSGASAYDPPTMGWSSWNTYRVNINEDLIKKQAKAMADQGLKEVGYKFINIDDGAYEGRDADGNLKPHSTRFPNGLKPVVDYIHSLGVKAGTYSDAGHNTCGNYWDNDPGGVGIGLYEHDQQDADFLFKELGFDFIKVDFCGGDPGQNTEKLDLDERTRYTAIHEAILGTGRTDVRMNVCRWAYPGSWVHDVASSWRISGDITNSWSSVKGIIDKNLFLSAYATEGHFNDMDMLEVGRGMTVNEDRTHFGMWCIMSSPLLIGCDMTTIDETTLALLKNEELIALNQDPLALQAYPVQESNDCYVLVKDIKERHGNTRAVAFYNPTDGNRTVRIDLDKLSLSGTIKVRDALGQRDVADITNTFYSTMVPAHGVRIYVMQGERIEQERYEAENAWLEQYSAIAEGDFARVQYAGNLSCGSKVGYLGDGELKDNFLEWRDVYSKEGGDYTIDIAYISGEDRSMTVTVNDEEPVTLENLNSGNWVKVATTSLNVKLKPGSNTIRLSNAKGWAPDVDYIDVKKAVPDGIAQAPTTQTDAESAAYYGIDGRQLEKSPEKGLYIHDHQVKVK